MQREQNGYEKF